MRLPFLSTTLIKKLGILIMKRFASSAMQRSIKCRPSASVMPFFQCASSKLYEQHRTNTWVRLAQNNASLQGHGSVEGGKPVAEEACVAVGPLVELLHRREVIHEVAAKREGRR